ncbi:hypothetical protein HY631_04070 [Candidatus Uhrbacteria bacterium]|nr:hypothetical protein [Candidatus Uhrbacteria bacterium]
MATIGAPRPSHHVVHLTEPSFSGEMHTICTLPITPNPQMLRGLIAGDQLAVTPTGSQMAMVRACCDEDELFHSSFDADIRFQRSPSKEDGGTRILQIGERHVLVWGCVSGYPPGVWLVAPQARTFLYCLERIKGSYGNGFVRLPVGESERFPGENAIITPWGLFPVRPGSKVEPYADGTLCVIEELDGRPYAYRVAENGIEPFAALVPVCEPKRASNDSAVRLVQWQGRCLLATRTPYRSSLMEVGAFKGRDPFSLLIDGQIEDVWSSPTQAVLLTLVRPREAKGDERRLLLNHEVLHEGHFTFARQDIFWSHDGSSCAARIRVTEGGQTHERLVSATTERAFAEGLRVSEALVSESGGIDAVIVHDGVWDQPIVHGRRLTAVPLAWNLHTENGAVVWNTVHDNLVLKWIDRTHLKPRVIRSTTQR